MSAMDPHAWADPQQGRFTHLHLDWDVDFERAVIRGSAIWTLESPREGRLDLDTRDLAIFAVTDQRGAALPWRLHPPEGFMGARLSVERREDTTALQIAYETSPRSTALQWLRSEHTAGKTSPFLFSQCQPIHARALVPCQDTALVRFTYTANVKVPPGLRPVMSAAPGVIEVSPEGTLTRFSMPQPIPSYLLAIAVGDLVSRDLGPRTRLYAEAPVMDAAAWEFAEAEAMLHAAEGIFGPYPWERFDFILMPPAFPYGGMENPRLTFLTPTLIAGDRSLVTVLAHELAHSWTGNLVTNATMNDFWLNEGFTVWAERRILEVLEGTEARDLAAQIGRHDLDLELERFADSPQWTRLQTDLTGMDPDEIYSSVPYEKGFLFVQAMELAAGRPRWDAFIKAYIAHFGFQSITTAQFEAFLEAQLPGLAAEVMAEAWLRGEGLPASAPPSGDLGAVSEALTLFPAQIEAITAPFGRWNTRQRIAFLQRLPRPISLPQCEALDGALGLTDSGNAEILTQWLLIGIASGYAPALARAASFLGEVGRMKYLKPLFGALLSSPETRATAARLLTAYGPQYHPIARMGLEGMIAKSPA